MLTSLPILLCLFCQQAPAPPAVTVTACPRIVAHDAAWQRRAAASLRSAAPELKTIAQEWISLRDQARVCAAGKRR